MRERHLKPERNRYASQPQRRGHATNLLKKATVILAGVVILWSVAAHYKQEHQPQQPFPPSGEVRWYIDKAPGASTAPLTISAPPDGNFAVKLSEWASGRAVAIVPVRAGESATVQVPLGEYRITIASGRKWEGPDVMFGRSGEVREVVEPMHFYKTNFQAMGNRIDLTSRPNGNLRTRRSAAF